MSDLPAVLTGTTKIFMMHMNYHSRASEHGDFPAFPVFYLKPPSTLSPNGADIICPAHAQGLVAEAEIALIIGQQARGLSEAQAWSHVGWVAPANDVTVLDFMYSEAPSLVRAKGWDSFTPIGELVDARHVKPDDIQLRLRVNGQIRQDVHSSDLIFNFARLVAELSQQMTLMPGDVILTGTPAGAPRIVHGDRVTVELVGLSSVDNQVRNATPVPESLTPTPMLTPKWRAHLNGVVAPRGFEFSAQLRACLASTTARALAQALRRDGHAAMLVSDIRHQGAPFAGHALTVAQVARPEGEEPSELDAMAARCMQTLRALGPDEVALFDGGLTGAEFKDLDRGWASKAPAGIVTASLSDGAPSRVPHAALAAEQSVRTVPVATDRPISIGSATIMPGDLIVADSTGTAIIPARSVQHIVTDAALLRDAG